MRYVWTDAGFENVIVEDYHPGCPMTDKLYPPIHPGEMLQEDVLDGFGITQHKLAVSIGCPEEDQRDRPRQATDLGRYCTAPGPLLCDRPAVLDQPAGPIRP